jgi:hypothetical protein
MFCEVRGKQEPRVHLPDSTSFTDSSQSRIAIFIVKSSPNSSIHLRSFESANDVPTVESGRPLLCLPWPGERPPPGTPSPSHMVFRRTCSFSLSLRFFSPNSCETCLNAANSDFLSSSLEVRYTQTSFPRRILSAFVKSVLGEPCFDPPLWTRIYLPSP